jgi:Fungal protein of unknown function (DUF2011)
MLYPCLRCLFGNSNNHQWLTASERKHRVRRSELLRDSPRSSSPPPSSSDFPQEQYTKQLEFDLEFIDVDRDDPSANQTSNATLQRRKDPSVAEPSPNSAKDGPEAFEFRLFNTSPRPTSTARNQLNTTSPPRTSHSGIHRINIRSPTPLTSAGDGAFVVPYRPQTYYFANVADLEQKKAYTDVAISGGQVLERASRTKWVGLLL